MKFFLIFAVTVASSLALPSIAKFHQQWNDFKIIHRKKFSDVNEELKRMNIFKDNLKKIEQHNKLFEAGEVTYSLAINQFGDITAEEFLEFLKISQTSPLISSQKFVRPSNVEAPEEIDWREQGAVGPIEDSGACGSAWPDSVTGALEAQLYLQVGELVQLSTQELTDCVSVASVDSGFDYVVQNGLTSAAEYPTDGCVQECRRGDKPATVQASGYVQIEEGNEEDLKSAVGTVGPVATTINANSEWQFYAGGILNDPSCTSDELNHAVLNVGYGVSDTLDYWILRNTWGTSWGEAGYLRLARNNGNECGIASWAFYGVL